MSKDFRLNADHDLYLDGVDVAQVENQEGDPAEVAQRVLITLKTQVGEYAWDTEAGFPYLSEAFVRNPDLDGLRARFRAVVGAVEGVTNVLQVELTIDKITRELKPYLAFDTPFGVGNVTSLLT